MVVPLNGASSLSGPGTRLEINQNSAFLRLPNELLQMITKHVDAGTFFATLLTCKRLIEIALSRPLLFHHLNCIPGLTLGLTDLSTPDLLLFFKQRVAQSGCAAGVLANVTKYAHHPGMSIAQFIPSDPSQPGNLSQLVTTQWDGVLQIYDLAEDHVRRRVELHIRPEGGCSSTRVEILKLSFSPSSRDLAILYRQKEHSRKANSSLKNAESLGDSEIYSLVTFHRCFAETLGYFYDSFLQETRDIEKPEGQKAVGLALASNGNACIAWRSQDRLNKTKICLVGRNGKIMVCLNFSFNDTVIWIGRYVSRIKSSFPLMRFCDKSNYSPLWKCTDLELGKNLNMVSNLFHCRSSLICVIPQSVSHCKDQP